MLFIVEQKKLNINGLIMLTIGKEFFRIFEIGQGNFNHAGRPGFVGGSAPSSGSQYGDVGFDDIKLSKIEKDFIGKRLDTWFNKVKPYEGERILPYINENTGDAFISKIVEEKLGDLAILKYGEGESYDAMFGINGRMVMARIEDISKETGVPKEIVSDMIYQWADSANDSKYASLFAQKCISEEFEVPFSDFQKEGLKYFDDAYQKILGTPGMNRKIIDGISGFKGKYSQKELAPLVKNYLKQNGISETDSTELTKFLSEDRNIKITDAETTKKVFRYVYEQTQRELARNGVKNILLARGFNSGEKLGLGVVKSWRGNSAESFSSNVDIADNFTHEGDQKGYIMFTNVPASRILSTCVTGIGSLREHEFVVLGGTDDVVYQKEY